MVTCLSNPSNFSRILILRYTVIPILSNSIIKFLREFPVTYDTLIYTSSTILTFAYSRASSYAATTGTPAISLPFKSLSIIAMPLIRLVNFSSLFLSCFIIPSALSVVVTRYTCVTFLFLLYHHLRYALYTQ